MRHATSRRSLAHQRDAAAAEAEVVGAPRLVIDDANHEAVVEAIAALLVAEVEAALAADDDAVNASLPATGTESEP